MGREKALIEIDGVAMMRRVADSLTDAGCAPVVAVGGDRVRLTGSGLAVITDGWPGEGPLGGIITALSATGTATCIVACDVPWVSSVTLRRLLEVAATSADDVDVVAASTGRLEPLCAVWLPSAAGPLADAFGAGERAVRRAMGALRVVTVEVDAADLRNVNTPADLPHDAPA